jgi:hypothetical protein
MAGYAMTYVELARVIVDQRDGEDQLQIGGRDFRRRTQERSGSAIGCCHEAGTLLVPFEYGPY